MSTEPTITPEVIDVSAIALPSPLRLAQPAFLTSLKEVEGQVTALKITDAASMQLAATLQVRLTKAGTLLETTRKALKAPFLEQGDKIDAAAKGPAARIDAAKLALKTALSAYDTAQRAIAAKAEADRQAKLRELERQRLDEEAAAKAKADALAKSAAEAAEKSKAPIMDLDFDDGPAEPPPKTATELEIEAVKHAPAVVPQKAEGVTFRTRLIHRVVSVAALPDPFVTKSANDAAIRATFCSGWREGEPLPVCAGVEFVVDKTPVSTGKAVF